MGVTNCCSSKNNSDGINQVNFVNGNIILSEEQINNEKEKEYFFSNLENKHFQKIKQNFENIVKYHGDFIVNRKIDEIIDEANPYVKEIDLPENIVKMEEPNCFFAPAIRFNTGEIYKGSWNSSNQRHGYGISISPDGDVYKGLWDEDKIGNYGLFVDMDGNYYKGELNDGISDGTGEIVVKNKYKYKGTFKDDLPNGKGCLENYEDNSKYNGEILNGKKEGKGILEYKDGTIYDGDFKNDQYDGLGVLKFPDGSKYEGEFQNGKIQGKGKFTWGDGKVYDGEYEDFMKKGFGKFYWNEDKYYEGQWLNNKQHGKGIIHYNGKEINGTFRFGKIIKENKIE